MEHTRKPMESHFQPKLTLDLALFTMADELDIPARRLRGGLARLIKRMRETNITLDTVQRHLEEYLG